MKTMQKRFALALARGPDDGAAGRLRRRRARRLPRPFRRRPGPGRRETPAPARTAAESPETHQ